jgi:hypothetical protein
MGEELAVINPAVWGTGGGRMAKLSRALKVGSTVGQLTMARSWAAAWHSMMARTGKAVALGRLREEEGVTPRVGQVGRAVDGRLGRLGQKPRNNYIRIE